MAIIIGLGLLGYFSESEPSPKAVNYNGEVDAVDIEKQEISLTLDSPLQPTKKIKINDDAKIFEIVFDFKTGKAIASPLFLNDIKKGDNLSVENENNILRLYQP